MSWVRLDDNFIDHPKIAGLSNAAFRLYIAGLCYSARYLTDGFVPDQVVVKSLPRRSQVAVKSLTTCGAWIRTEGGYQIHDYDQYQESRSDVLARRESDRQRQADWRSRHAVTNNSRNAVSPSAPSRPSSLKGVKTKEPTTLRARPDPPNQGLSAAYAPPVFDFPEPLEFANDPTTPAK